jgi:hypothetical protein
MSIVFFQKFKNPFSRVVQLSFRCALPSKFRAHAKTAVWSDPRREQASFSRENTRLRGE